LSNVPSVSYPVQQQQQQQAFPTFHPLLLALGTSQLQSPIFQSLHMQQQQQVNQSHVTPIQSAHMQPFFTPQYMQKSLLPQNVSMSGVFPGVFPGSSIAQQFNYPVIQVQTIQLLLFSQILLEMLLYFLQFLDFVNKDNF
jgi:hypothetical protein